MDFFIETAWAQQAAQPSLFGSMAPLLIIVVLFYFLLIRPQNKRQKEHREMVAALEKDQEVVTGGGVNSAMWRQIISDVCNAPVTVLQQSEGAAFGAALQAVSMLDQSGGDLKSLVDDHLARDEERCCEPRSSAVNFYNDTYNKYQQAVDKVAALYS